MAEPPQNDGGLPQLPHDPARISKFIQGVVQHNTQASGSRWPPQATETQTTSAAMHPPTPSPGGNVQPSPKDSGVDMNSPTHREDGVHVDTEHEENGHCASNAQKTSDVVVRRDSAVVDCGPYGLPSSVESGMIVDTEGQDIDPGGEDRVHSTGLSCLDNDHSVSMDMPDLLDSQEQQQQQHQDTGGNAFGKLQVSSSSGNGSSSNSSSLSTQLSLSVPTEPSHHQYHHSQNIFEKFLTNPSSNNVSLAELNTKHSSVHSNRHDSHRLQEQSKVLLKKGDSVASQLSLFGDSALLDLNSQAVSRAAFSGGGLGEHSESDGDSFLVGPHTDNSSNSAAKFSTFSPLKELVSLKTSANSAFSSGLTPPSKLSLPLPKTPSSDTLFLRNKTSGSPASLGCSMSSSQNLFDINLMESSDEEFDCKLECRADVDSGPDSPPILQPVGPVPNRSRSQIPASLHANHQQPQQQQQHQQLQSMGSFSPGYLSEFAKFLKKTSPPKSTTRSKKSSEPAKPRRMSKVQCNQGSSRKRHSVAASTDETALGCNNDMLPVLKLRKLSAGNYAPVQQPTSPPVLSMATAGNDLQTAVQSQKPPRLKIKYGSPEMGHKRQVIDVPYKQLSATVAKLEKEKQQEISEDDEYVLKDQEQLDEIDVSDRLSSRTLSPPVLHLERAVGEDSGLPNTTTHLHPRQHKHNIHHQQDPAMQRPSSSSPTTKCCKTMLLRHQKEDFNIKTFLSLQAKVIKLRRKVLRLCKLLFPELTYPHRFSREGPQVEALLDQVISAAQDNCAPWTGPCALPTGDPCCWEVNVVMCKTPRVCLQSLRSKICSLLEVILPGLDLGKEFDRHGDMVDELLHRVFTNNRQRLREDTAEETLSNR